MPLPSIPARDDGDAACDSGTSPTLHLLGAGKVGRALLRRLPGTPYRLTGLTDSSASIHDAAGLDPIPLAARKQAGERLASRRDARAVPLTTWLSLRVADAVVDCTATEPARGAHAVERTLAALDAGSCVVLAAKHALLRAPDALLEAPRGSRLGFNAVLGGTGLALVRELDELRAGCRTFAGVTNATTTAVIEAIERGEGFDGALASARAAGLLEDDAELDLDGSDAATKLAIVASLLAGRPRGVEEIDRPHARDLDPELLRRRRREGTTTRLVGRILTDGRLRLRYEAVPLASTLAVGSRRVAYTYGLGDASTRFHLGSGLGPDGTAAAILEDLEALVGSGRVR